MRNKSTYNIDDLVVFGTLVRFQVMSEALRIGGDIATLGSLEVVGHAGVEGEHRRRSTDLSTHVANCSHTRARERLDTGTLVLNDGTSAALDSEDTSNLENDVYTEYVRRARPGTNLS